jgi:hypothetical protein
MELSRSNGCAELWQVPDWPAPAAHASALGPQPACWVGQNYTVVFAIDIVSALPPSAA